MSVFTQYCQGPLTEACPGGAGAPTSTPDCVTGPMTQCSGVQTCCQPCVATNATHGPVCCVADQAQGQAAGDNPSIWTIVSCGQHSCAGFTCAGAQTCGGDPNCELLPTAGGNTQCSGIHTCCAPCGAAGQAVTADKKNTICAGPTVCGPEMACTGPTFCGETCGPNCEILLTAGGNTQCSGIHTCCAPCAAAGQAAGGPGGTHVTVCPVVCMPPYTMEVPPTCAGQTQCSGIHTCCGVCPQDVAQTVAATCDPAACGVTIDQPTCGGPTACSGVQTCCVVCPTQAFTCNPADCLPQTVPHTACGPCDQAVGGGPVTEYVTCGGPTRCAGIHTCAPGCGPVTEYVTCGGPTRCAGIHTCAPGCQAG